MHHLNGLKMTDFKTFDEFKVSLMNYIKSYNEKVHSSLNGLSPSDTFYKEPNKIRRIDPILLEEHFLLEMDRTVTADNVISVDKIKYEVPYKYSKQKIRLRYTPDMKEVYVQDKKTKELVLIKLLNVQENSKIKRIKPKLAGGDGK